MNPDALIFSFKPETVIEDLIVSIKELQNSLQSHEQLAFILPGIDAPFIASRIELDKTLLVFTGHHNGRPAKLFQSVSQLNVIAIIESTESKPNRIGF